MHAATSCHTSSHPLRALAALVPFASPTSRAPLAIALCCGTWFALGAARPAAAATPAATSEAHGRIAAEATGTSLTILAPSVSPSDPAGLPVRIPEVLNLQGAPFELAAPAQTDAAPPADQAAGPAPISIRFLLENTSSGRLDLVGLEAAVVTVAGDLAGYEVFEARVSLEPGQQSSVDYVSALLKAAPGDRVAVFPYAAAGRAGSWQVDGEMRQQLRTALLDSRTVPGSPLPLAPDHQQLPPGAQILGAADCAAACEADRQSCVAFCRCGMSSHHCSCNDDGTATFTCACYSCPAN